MPISSQHLLRFNCARRISSRSDCCSHCLVLCFLLSTSEGFLRYCDDSDNLPRSSSISTVAIVAARILAVLTLQLLFYSSFLGTSITTSGIRTVSQKLTLQQMLLTPNSKPKPWTPPATILAADAAGVCAAPGANFPSLGRCHLRGVQEPFVGWAFMYERADPKAICSGEGAEEFQASAAKDGDSFGAWARLFGGLGVQGLQPAAISPLSIGGHLCQQSSAQGRAFEVLQQACYQSIFCCKVPLPEFVVPDHKRSDSS